MKQTVFTLFALGGLLIFAALSVFAQEENLDFRPAEGVKLSFSQEVQPQVEVKTAEFADGAATTAYLPTVSTPPVLDRGGAYYKTSCSAPEFSLRDVANDGTSILIGRPRILAFAARARGYQGSQYSTQFLVNGNELVSLGNSGFISSSEEYIQTNALIFSTAGACDGQLPAGTYSARFIIDGKLVTQYSVVVN